jgi:hypothetical protein
MPRRISLGVRLTVLILFAALVPLAAVVGIATYRARQALTDQGQAQLSSDANAKATLIDSYIYERLQDGQALATLPTVAPFILCQTLPVAPDALKCTSLGPTYLGSNQRALVVGLNRDCNYLVWSLFDGHGNPLLAYQQNLANLCKGDQVPLPLNQVAQVPAADVRAVMSQGQSYISPVYYDGKHASVQLYAPIIFANPLTSAKGPVGFLRATLNLDYIWGIVGHELGANGSGSNAFIADANGVRVASSNPSELFTAVKPLDQVVVQEIQTDKRFGSATAPSVVDLPQVADSLDATDTQQTFQSVADPSSTTQYQFVRIRLDKLALDRNGGNISVPLGWSYFVLSPTATVTQIATDQVYYSLASAAVVAVLAILIGLFIGSRITKPVQRSVAELEGATVRLNELASHQQHSSSEQHWVVDACQTGLDSVRYLSDAMHQAAKRVTEASNWFGDYWDRLTEEQARRTVQHLQELAHYIEEAARRQQASSERLGKAITVTRQVSDQLVSGATAASESADQLQLVVNDLHRVVGGPARRAPASDVSEVPLEEQFGVMPGMAPGMGQFPAMGPGMPGMGYGMGQGMGQAPQYGSGYPPDPMYGGDPLQGVGSLTPRSRGSGWGEYDPGMGSYGGNGSYGGYNGNSRGNSAYGGQYGSASGPQLPNPPSVWGPPGAWGDR